MAREMKDSGIEWIGEIPQKWSCHALKVIIIQNDGGIWGDDPLDNDGEIVLRSTEQTIDGKWNIVSPAKRDLSKIPNKIYYLCKKNDLLITKSSGSNLHIGKTTIVDDIIEETQCYYSNFIQRIRLSQAVSVNYYWYILNSDISRSQFTYMQNTTSGIGNINAKYIANLIVPEPPVQEQYCIEKYLDVKCAEIDNVLEKTRASIEEYKKLKKAVITQAVTKGIRGDREMKDSGIEWIGEIPVEWNLIKVTRLLDYSHPYPIGDGDHGLIKTDDYIDAGVPYIRVQNLGWGTELDCDNIVYISEERNQVIANSILKPNDILFAKTGATIGKTAIVPSSIPVSNTTSHIGKMTVSSDYSPRFVFYVMSSYLVYRQFWEMAGLKSTRPELSIDEIKKIKLVIPSRLEEQQEIVSYLDKKCSAIDALIVKKEQYLAEIENYKKSLIYEYVTGKKEVP